ncbi:hypothetical protein [Streptomyces caeruleatus]|uniref:Secreted protein n=1 Tax=Streptomyces caeruleatus TaxID=661399 RepID=A0A101TNR9_9ACTN|nr:hypothetical protein [Streptomyces caeruleatus]KUN95678.1 hypothetical protein AQJ67_34535 [Streptomyces caeruleatus]
MAFALRKRNSGKRVSARTAGMVAALTVGASLLTAPQALADSDPGPVNLLKACDWASLCKFHPQSYWTYTGPRHKVGDVLFNCGSQTNSTAVTWEDTTSSSNSAGISTSLEYKFLDAFEAEIQTSYSHTWSRSHTDRQMTTVNVPRRGVGWIERGVGKQQATGWWEIQFKKRYYGHFDWYVYNYKESGWRSTYGYINTKDRAMTSGEWNQHCR